MPSSSGPFEPLENKLARCLLRAVQTLDPMDLQLPLDRYTALKRAAMRLMFAGDLERYMRTLRLMELSRARSTARA